MSILYQVEKRPMVYGNVGDLPIILAGGEFQHNPYKYLVVNHAGSHPCCYIGVPNGKVINTGEVICHGGVTWNGPKLPELLEETIENKDFLKDYWWFGWDYAHFGDFVYSPYAKLGHKWTTEECINDCLKVIDILMMSESTGLPIYELVGEDEEDAD